MKKQSVELKNRDIAVALGAALLGIVFVSLAVWGGFNIGLTIFNVLILLIGTLYLKRKGKSVGAFGVALFATSLIGSLSFTLSTNGAVNFVLFIMLFFNMSAYFYLVNRGSKKLGDLRILPTVLASTFATSLEGLSSSTSALFSRKSKSATIKKLLIGGACSLPALLIIIPLLVSSDAAFEGLVKTVSEDVILWVIKIILGLAIAPVIFSYFFSNRKYPDNFNFKNGLPKNTIDGTYAISFLGVISACYLVYLFSQLAYFMGGLSGILPKEFTVAEYARRGFFEITAISAINFLLFAAGLLFIKRAGSIKDKIVKGLLLFIGLFTMLLIITAIAKMVLYIGSFGMTELRILTSVFLIFLFGVCVLLVARSIKSSVSILRPTMLIAIILLSVMGIVGVNRTVAAYNTNAYLLGKLKTLDATTISECGPVSVEYLIKLEAKLSKNKNTDEYNEVMDGLIDNFLEMYEINDGGNNRRIKSSSFAAFNVEKEVAYRHFNKFIKKNPEFKEKVKWRENVHFDKYNDEDYEIYEMFGSEVIEPYDDTENYVYEDDNGFIHAQEVA